LAQVLLGAVIVIALVVTRGTRAGNEPIHLTSDWSNRHLVFSAPQNLGQHVYLLSNPRYVQQLVRRNAERRDNRDDRRWRRAPETPDLLIGDWSLNMGPSAKAGAGVYPAKFSFDPASANCATDPQPDFVVYNTSLAGITTSTDASQTGTFSGTGTTNAQTVTIGGTLILYANTGALASAHGTVTPTNAQPNAGDTVRVGAVTYRFETTLLAANDVLRGGSTTAAAGNLEAAINHNSAQ
jgi:hypothetical protein